MLQFIFSGRAAFGLPVSIVLGAFVVLCVLLTRVLLIGRRPKDFPPGPPAFPVLGNIHQFPKSGMHYQFEKWAKEYGPIYSLMVGTRTWIVINKDETAKDLLDKRSNIYSGRPDMYVPNLASGNLRYLLMDYDATWRQSRKLAHNFLNIQISKKYFVYQDLETKQLIDDLLDDPKGFVGHLRRFATSLSAIMIFGIRYPQYDTHEVKELYEVIDKFSSISRDATAALMDFYPILRYLPDWANPITKSAKHMYREALELYLQYWDNVKQNEKNGIGIKSFAQDLSKVQEKEKIDDIFSAFMAGMLMEGGSDTTSTTLQGFLQAMVLWPEIQKKAQEEVDRVVGTSRLPTFDDYDSLPYIRACVKELLRWLPPSTLGMPHSTSAEDEYMGYHIPKGAHVILNIWAINNDEKRAPDPRTFRPERYLDDHLSAAESAALTDATKRDHFTFGAGRRICQGLHIAERSLFIAMARVVWAFNIQKVKGPDGSEVEVPPDNFTDALVLTLKPFQIDIQPRDSERIQIIRKEAQAAKQSFSEMNFPV